jgi:hypothetical protein
MVEVTGLETCIERDVGHSFSTPLKRYARKAGDGWWSHAGDFEDAYEVELLIDAVDASSASGSESLTA